MTKLHGFFVVLILLTTCLACNKKTCPDYWQYPDCTIQGRTRFYGMYKGISLMDNEQPVTTQWMAGPGNDVSEIIIAANVTIQLDPKDNRVFKFKEGCFIMGNQYIRNEGYGGRFTADSLYFDFWLDEGYEQTPGEKRIHYTFAGKRK